MVQIETLALAVLSGNSLEARALAQDFMRSKPELAQILKPVSSDERILATSASLLELFASRMNQQPPAWTAEIGPVSEPLFLLNAAKTMKRLRQLCEAESPEPLKKRQIYAPPNYLEYV